METLFLPLAALSTRDLNRVGFGVEHKLIRLICLDLVGSVLEAQFS